MTELDAERSSLDLRLVPAALSGWAGSAVGILWPVGYFVALGCGLLVVGVVAVRARLPRAMMAGLLAALIAGSGFALAAAMRYQAVQRHPLTHWDGQIVAVSVRVTEDPRTVAGGARAMVRGELTSLGTPPTAARGAVVIFGSVRSFGALGVGETVDARAAVRRPQHRDLTVATLVVDGPVRVSRAGSIHRVANAIRQRFTLVSEGALTPQDAALLPALVLGDTTALDADTVASFRTAGLTHLMAVSGANVSIVCGTVLLLGRLVGPRTAVAFAVLALVCFVLVVRPSPSVLRAAVMGGIGLLGVVMSRRRQAIPALAATTLVLLAFSPALAVSIGFALSVAATAALVVLAPRWSARLVARGWPRPLADAVCVAVAAQMVTAPLVAAVSGSVSLTSVGANLAAGIVVVPITVIGTAAATIAALSPTAAGILVRFCGPELWWLRHVADVAAGGGSTTVPAPSGAVGFLTVAAVSIVAAWLWRRIWFRAMAACAGLCLVALVISAWLRG